MIRAAKLDCFARRLDLGQCCICLFGAFHVWPFGPTMLVRPFIWQTIRSHRFELVRILKRELNEARAGRTHSKHFGALVIELKPPGWKTTKFRVLNLSWLQSWVHPDSSPKPVWIRERERAPESGYCFRVGKVNFPAKKAPSDLDR